MNKARRQVKSHRKGISIIATTLLLLVIVPLVGLAVDLTMLYLVKSKLLSATDAAVLSGARALSQGTDPTSQKIGAQGVASKFFRANFATDYWGSRNLNFPAVAIDDASVPNYRTVTATASVQSPLFFLRVLRQDYATVAVSSQAARRDALVILVLDRSSSMNWTVPGTGQTACQIMKTDALEFVKNFAQGRDQLGLVTFGSSVYSYQSRTDFNTRDASGYTISSLISGIECYGNTSSAQALHAAYAEIQRVNNANRANVIVFMTDGRPNGVTADFVSSRSNANCNPNAHPLIGVLAQWANNASTGDTAGLMQHTGTGVNAPNPEVYTSTNSSGCNFRSDLKKVRQDLGKVPTADIYGNRLDGPYEKPVNLNRVDLPQEISKASANALDNQATAIRTDTTLRPMIYTLGLMGNGQATDQPDSMLLKKVSNDSSLAREVDPGPTYYTAQQNQTRGMYVEAPDATQLAAAFDMIAAHIVVRLSR
jgi:Flp pilus assembly protein TadG